MRCLCCNNALTDYEAARKDSNNAYLDLCTACYYPIRKEVELSNNFDLSIVDKGENVESYSEIGGLDDL